MLIPFSYCLFAVYGYRASLQDKFFHVPIEAETTDMVAALTSHTTYFIG